MLLTFVYTYRLGSELGSGQFGVVYKGALDAESGVSEEEQGVEVAVKTLKEGSGEEDRVKFLQEAAIMGQFKHPNVVTMYGVVTDGEPVSLQLVIGKPQANSFLCSVILPHNTCWSV